MINNLREMSIKLDETLEKVKLRNYEKPSVNSESSRGKCWEEIICFSGETQSSGFIKFMNFSC